MKKQGLLIGFAIVAIAVAAFFIFYWPPVDDNEAAGAFTKADKYKEYSISEEDIILRTDILKDPETTQKIILQLVEFNDFALYVKAIISEWWIPVLQKYYTNPDISEAIALLNEFIEFIENNNETVFSTVLTLVDLNTSESHNITTDVESQLKKFFYYANQFLVRDSVFETTISKIDNSLQNDAKLAKGIDDLKSLRDNIVVDNFFYGITVGDTSKITYSAKQTLHNTEKLNLVAANFQQLGTVYSFLENFNNSNLTSKFDAQKVENAQNVLGIYLNKVDLGAYKNNIYLAQNNSQYFAWNQEQLKDFMNVGKIDAQNNTINVVFNTADLGVIVSNQEVQFYKDKFLGCLNEYQLGLFNHDELGFVAARNQAISVIVW